MAILIKCLLPHDDQFDLCDFLSVQNVLHDIYLHNVLKLMNSENGCKVV